MMQKTKKQSSTWWNPRAYPCISRTVGENKCGTPIDVGTPIEVADVLNILEATGDYLEPEFHAECERVFPEVDNIPPF